MKTPYIRYSPFLEECTFLLREKRFLVHVLRKNGEQEIVHCANSGSMKSCILPKARAFILDSQNPERKLRHSLELLELEDGLACLNTARANELVDKFLQNPNPEIPGADLLHTDFPSLEGIRREAKYNAHTRFDFGFPRGWIEVKSVSLRMDENTLAFPDAVTTRGQKHLRELSEAVQNGEQAFLFFAIMRGSNIPASSLAKHFRPAFEIDPTYNTLITQSLQCGVKIRIIASDISTSGIGVRGYFRWENTRS